MRSLEHLLGGKCKEVIFSSASAGENLQIRMLFSTNLEIKFIPNLRLCVKVICTKATFSLNSLYALFE